MCTRPNPSWRSVPTSARALGLSLLAVVHALAVLVLAVMSVPLRWLWPSRWSGRPAPLTHIEVQVHLGDPSCVAELEAILWKTLARAEQTWAPLRLPVDRVVVGAGFPSTGRADIYDDFVAVTDGVPAGQTSVQPRRRVVISLGVRDGTRDLDGWEIAGALAAQIQALVDDLCRQHKSIAAPPPDPTPVAVSTRLTRPVSVLEPQPRTEAPAPTHAGRVTTAPTERCPDQEVPGFAELLATMQQGQPLVAAGPTSNGTHP
jgi:hypothetical protein